MEESRLSSSHRLAEVTRYFDLASQADTGSYFAQFTEDATVEDEGVRRRGIDDIRTWRTEVPRVAYTVHDIVAADSGHDAHVDIAGDFPGSPVRLTFHFEFTANDHIVALDIHP
ncbi:MAG TPA: nuclear transport factor 2 family protein [Acidimicrobiia bacterium]|nr:nuclear transport factor 2 family protein [Acidimicrobiia bacterium]